MLKCDVRKFFPNIDHAILLEKLRCELRCEGVLALCARILASYRTGEEVPQPLFPGDDLAAAVERPRGLPIGNLTSQLRGNFFLDALDHRIAESAGHGAYLRYTDDFLLFSNDKARLWELHAIAREELAVAHLKLAEPKSRLLATREGVPFCGFRFLPGLRPRVLGATKRRFETRRAHIFRVKAPLARLSAAVFAWYQFSREGNTAGLLRAYTRWTLGTRLRRRRGRMHRVLRGASWNNSNRENLLSSNRNHNAPTNRNNNNGFRCVVGVSAPKAAMPEESARCGAGDASPAGAKMPA